MTIQPIYIRRGSDLHRTNIELYRRHHDPGGNSDPCHACGQPRPCPTERHAAVVIRAAGEEPGWYNGELPGGSTSSAATPWPLEAQPSWQPTEPPSPAFSGYRLGGHGRRADVPDFQYER